MRSILRGLCCAAVLAAPLRGQETSGGIGAQGTMAFNVIWSGTRPQNGFVDAGVHLAEQRYSGRVALRVASGLYVGAGVASSQSNITQVIGVTTVSTLSEAVVVGPYLQYYPLRRIAAFVRGGAGYANTWSYDGGGNSIQGFKGDRLAESAGVGADLPLRRHLALTLSVDYTAIGGTSNYAETRSTMMLGLGLTVR